MQKNSNIENFDSTLYSTSGSMPLKCETRFIMELKVSHIIQWGMCLLRMG